MQCHRCTGEQFVKAGCDRAGRQMDQCAACKRRQTARSASAFRGDRFPDDIVALAVRWYLRFRLPYADLVELLAAWGVHADASTVFDWVRRFTPLYKRSGAPAPPSCRRSLGRGRDGHPPGRAVGRRLPGHRCARPGDRRLSERDARHGNGLLRAGDRAHRRAGPAASRPMEVEHITGQAEHQSIERGHQHLKGRTRCMRGVQRLGCAPAVCGGQGVIRNLRDGFYH